ncbi:MAG: ankyrin repeat domain-containing protein [Candidatus Aminicenantes bacterium]|nr:ankyrin repeat domain-containing protein [Candidatus Aminicenantes bacterium]
MKIKKNFIVPVVLFVLAIPFFAAEIHDAVWNGDLVKINEILKKDPKAAQAKDKNGKTPLHMAAQYNRGAAAALLIKNGADPNAKNENGEAPLHYASFLGRVQVMALLIEKGADINTADKAGNTPLHHALSRGHKQIIDLLVKNGVKIKTGAPDAVFMLHRAAALGHKGLVDILVTGGVDLTAQNKDGGTLLHSAATGGLTYLSEKLIKKGIKVNQRNIYGAAALHIAAAYGREKAAALLIKHGADINSRTPDGFSPLNIAEKNSRKEIAKLLIEKGADRGAAAFPVLKGKYFGQKTPGKKPLLFAPGIISTSSMNERDITFSPGFDEFYYSRNGKIFFSKGAAKKWSMPDIASFSKQYESIEACFFPDGKKLFFLSKRTLGRGAIPWELFFVERKGEGWSEVKPLGDSFKGSFYPSFTKAGTMYYTDSRNDLYRSDYEKGEFQTAEKLSNNVNTDRAEYNSFIAADESYLIFTSFGWGQGSGGGDLFISFRNEFGSWSKAINLGPEVNSAAHDYCPSVTPDGKYFFFASNRAGNEDIYWVDAEVLLKVKPAPEK